MVRTMAASPWPCFKPRTKERSIFKDDIGSFFMQEREEWSMPNSSRLILKPSWRKAAITEISKPLVGSRQPRYIEASLRLRSARSARCRSPRAGGIQQMVKMPAVGKAVRSSTVTCDTGKASPDFKPQAWGSCAAKNPDR